ncbi:hypothetical protein J1N35_019365 [Gossypium stocksii]|uniref:Uncharacterized protein n=1 Tax=Gossypium stocksii TaxID=47602 RepID=A0A9D4A7J2_9ROSI|nr:hypothetical protein J1N35_019365 [Gossypium stocksii]
MLVLPTIQLEKILLVERYTGLSVVGGVVSDETRKWILGYSRFLWKCLAFDAELWAFWMVYY